MTPHLPDLKAIVREQLRKSAELKPEVELQPQQVRAVQQAEKAPGLLLYHGLGSGKTLSALAAAEQTGGEKTVITPAALRQNFLKELKKFVKKPTGYDVMSYDEAVRRQELKETASTIIDEAHRMGRAGTGLSRLPEKVKGKVLLLTGSPIRNEPAELYPLLKAVAKDRPIPASAEAFKKRFVGRESVWPGLFGWLRGVKPVEREVILRQGELKSLLRGRVSYHPGGVGEYPQVSEEHVDVEMSPQQTELYNAFMKSHPDLAYKIRRNLPPSRSESKRLNAFLSAVRQVSNNPQAYDVSLQGHVVDHSPKMQRMLVEIRKRSKDPDFKAVVYSNYLESGILPMAEKLTEMGIPSAVFTGRMDDEHKRRAVESYNRGKAKVLLISGAGAEGLDLKGTQLVQLMEPHWNRARIDQVIGRTARHMSHSHLPPDKQKVHVQRFYATPKPSLLQRWGLSDKEIGADRYLHELSSRKHELVSKMLDILKEVGQEKPV